MPRRFLILVSLLCFITACSDRPTPTSPRNNFLAAISDGAHNAGNTDFFFLPPLVANPVNDPNFDAGKFDAKLRPVVSVFLLPGGGDDGCTFTAASVYGPSVAPVEGEQYHIDWNTRASNLVAGKDYRICVFASNAGTLLGFLDVEPIAGGMKNARTGETYAFQDDRTLPIKFRIERGALCANHGNGATCTVFPAVTSTGGDYKLLSGADSVPVAAVAIPPGAIPPTDTVSIVIEKQAPPYLMEGEAQCLPTDLSQSKGCYRFSTDPPGYQFATDVRIEICVDAEGLDPDALRLFKYNTTDHLVQLPWLDPTLIDCTGFVAMGPTAAPSSFAARALHRLGSWAAQLFAPQPLYATVFGGVPKGVGGGGGSFSDFGSAVPEVPFGLLPPDAGASLVFTARDLADEFAVTHIVRLDVGAPAWVTIFSSAVSRPKASFFPAGDRLAFTAMMSDGMNDIYTMRLDGSDMQRPGFSDGRYYPSVNPRDTIAFGAASGGIWYLSSGFGSPLFPGSPGQLLIPAYSPEGARIAFQYSPDGIGYDIYVMGGFGQNVQRLTYGLGSNSPPRQYPAWDPSGTALAFSCVGPSGHLDLCMMGADGSGIRRILQDGTDHWQPTWSPNGAWIAFVGGVSPNTDIFLVRPNGTGLRKLTDGSMEFMYPAWPLPQSWPDLIPDQISNAPADATNWCSYALQTFTPSISAFYSQLSAIDLPMQASSPFPSEGFTPTVNIRGPVTDADTVGPVIATSSTFVPGTFSPGGTVRFSFSPAVTLEPTYIYLMEVLTPTMALGTSKTVTDTYASGHLASCGAPSSEDLIFTTWWHWTY